MKSASAAAFLRYRVQNLETSEGLLMACSRSSKRPYQQTVVHAYLLAERSLHRTVEETIGVFKQQRTAETSRHAHGF